MDPCHSLNQFDTGEDDDESCRVQHIVSELAPHNELDGDGVPDHEAAMDEFEVHEPGYEYVGSGSGRASDEELLLLQNGHHQGRRDPDIDTDDVDDGAVDTPRREAPPQAKEARARSSKMAKSRLRGKFRLSHTWRRDIRRQQQKLKGAPEDPVPLHRESAIPEPVELEGIIVLDDDYAGEDLDMWLAQHKSDNEPLKAVPFIKAPTSPKVAELEAESDTSSEEEDLRPLKKAKYTPDRRTSKHVLTQTAGGETKSNNAGRSSPPPGQPLSDKEDSSESESHFDQKAIQPPEAPETSDDDDFVPLPATPFNPQSPQPVTLDSSPFTPPQPSSMSTPKSLRNPLTPKTGYALRSARHVPLYTPATGLRTITSSHITSSPSTPFPKMARFYKPVIEQFHDKMLLDDDQYQEMLDEAEDGMKKNKKVRCFVFSHTLFFS